MPGGPLAKSSSSSSSSCSRPAARGRELNTTTTWGPRLLRLLHITLPAPPGAAGPTGFHVVSGRLLPVPPSPSALRKTPFTRRNPRRRLAGVTLARRPPESRDPVGRWPLSPRRGRDGAHGQPPADGSDPPGGAGAGAWVCVDLLELRSSPSPLTSYQ